MSRFKIRVDKNKARAALEAVAGFSISMNKATALKQIAHAAVDAEKMTGCPAELMAAQCAIETGWLKHSPGNNCFGIKAYTGCYGKQLLKTVEWLTIRELAQFLKVAGRSAVLDSSSRPTSAGRQRYVCRDYFATFETLGHCFAKRAEMWNKGRYAKHADDYKLRGNLEALVRGIGPIYATDPKYADTVLKIIHSADVQAALKEARQTI